MYNGRASLKKPPPTAAPAASLDSYDRLIDCVREDPAVLKRLHVDVSRLCAAHLVRDGDDDD